MAYTAWNAIIWRLRAASGSEYHLWWWCGESVISGLVVWSVWLRIPEYPNRY